MIYISLLLKDIYAHISSNICVYIYMSYLPSHEDRVNPEGLPGRLREVNLDRLFKDSFIVVIMYV